LENGFELAGADDGVDFRDVSPDLVAIALDEAPGDDEFFGAAGGFEASHFEDGVDGFLFRGVNEGAGVDDEDFGVFRAGCEACAGAVEEAHHDLGVDEVFGAAERDEADRWGRFFLRFAHYVSLYREREFHESGRNEYDNRAALARMDKD
jgi:hypothetical protein